MADKGLVSKSKLIAIGDAIRRLLDTSIQFPLDGMASALNGIQKRNVSDLTVSENTVTVPAGLYSSNVSKAINNADGWTSTDMSIESSGIIKSTIKPTTAGYINTSGNRLQIGTITMRNQNDVTYNNNTLTVPAGYYANEVQKTIASSEMYQHKITFNAVYSNDNADGANVVLYIYNDNNTPIQEFDALWNALLGTSATTATPCLGKLIDYYGTEYEAGGMYKATSMQRL